MFTIHRARRGILAIAAMLSVALMAPVAAQTEDQPLAAAPAAPSWDATSGYGVVETTRAAISGPTWDEASGYGAVETTRALNALPEEPAVIQSLVPSDVRWAPARAIAPALSVEARRVAAARHALLSDDLGSLQEEGLLAVVAAGRDDRRGYGAVEATRAAISEDGVTAVLDEAELLAQFRAIELAQGSTLGVEQSVVVSCEVVS